MEGDVAEDGEGAAVVASTLPHRECVVLPVVSALFHKNTADFSNFSKLLLNFSGCVSFEIFITQS